MAFYFGSKMTLFFQINKLNEETTNHTLYFNLLKITGLGYCVTSVASNKWYEIIVYVPVNLNQLILVVLKTKPQILWLPSSLK